jgi:hypothetical protein
MKYTGEYHCERTDQQSVGFDLERAEAESGGVRIITAEGVDS